MHLISQWAEQINQQHILAEQVSRHWLEYYDEVHELTLSELRDWNDGRYFSAGEQSALVLKKLVGRPKETAENHSVIKDQWREADFLAGYICGLSGDCGLQSYL